MKPWRIAIMCILLHLPLALAILLGAFVLPDYLETRDERLKHENYFLGHTDQYTTGPDEPAAARCSVFMERLLTEYHHELAALGREAYDEYATKKAACPDISPYSLAGEYMRRLRRLESRFDARFNDYLAAMENKTGTGQLSPGIAKQARYAYRLKKLAIKNEFYRKAKQVLSSGQ